MTPRRIIATLAGAFAVAAVGLAFATPAQASGVYPTEPWQVNDAAGPAYPYTFQPAQYSTVQSSTSALLKVGDGITGGTELRTDNLGIAVEAGAEVSFRYELHDGATCSLGAPRIFLYATADADTMNTAPWVTSAGDCGAGGAVTLAVPEAATLGTVGFAYDNGTGGSVVISELSVDGTAVLFTEPDDGCGYEVCPTPSAEPEPTPSAGPSGSPSPRAGESPPAGGGDDDEGLPVTGANTGVVAAVAVGLAGLGTVMYLAARRRRVRFVTE